MDRFISREKAEQIYNFLEVNLKYNTDLKVQRKRV